MLTLLVSIGCNRAAGTLEEDTAGWNSPQQTQGTSPSTDALPSGDGWEVVDEPATQGDDLFHVGVETPAETEDGMKTVALAVGEEYPEHDWLLVKLHYGSGGLGHPSVLVGEVEVTRDAVSGELAYDGVNYLPKMEQDCHTAAYLGEDMAETPPEWGCWQWFDY